MTLFKRLEDEVSSWVNISTHPHRFGGKEFRFGDAEVGHVHAGGIVDIPFPRVVHDALLARGLAEEQRWVPHSGWITFLARSEEDLRHALWLMRLSYLRYALKSASDPSEMLKHESGALQLSTEFQALLRQFVPRQQAPS